MSSQPKTHLKTPPTPRGICAELNPLTDNSAISYWCSHFSPHMNLPWQVSIPLAAELNLIKYLNFSVMVPPEPVVKNMCS